MGDNGKMSSEVPPKTISRQERRWLKRAKETMYTCQCGYATYPTPTIDPTDGHVWYQKPDSCPNCGRGLVKRVVPKK